MSEAPVREWRFCVDDMIGFAETVMEYTAGLDQDAFLANRLVYDATLRNLELLGEVAVTRQRFWANLVPPALQDDR